MKRSMNRILIRLVFSFILLCCCILFGQYSNIQVNYQGSIDPQEVTITINPANPLNLAAGANLDYYYSMDGGLTWAEGRLISMYGIHGDPPVTFDHLGNLYYGHLSNPAFGYWIDGNAGSHSVVWRPDGFSSGIYYYQIRTEKQTAIRKCLYLK